MAEKKKTPKVSPEPLPIPKEAHVEAAEWRPGSAALICPHCKGAGFVSPGQVCAICGGAKAVRVELAKLPKLEHLLSEEDRQELDGRFLGTADVSGTGSLPPKPAA